MKRFIKYCFLFSLPFLFFIVGYIVVDPFKVIRHYNLYYTSDDCIGINRGYVSTMHYINHKDVCHYDSFIFGNSRSLAFHGKEWKKYLPESTVCYHFDESGGSVGGILYKIVFINKVGCLKNVLLVVDYQLLANNEQIGHLFSLPPVLNNNSGALKFHWENFTAFYDMNFLRAFVDFKLWHKYKQYMGWLITDPQKRTIYNPVNNELYSVSEESIERDEYFDDEHIKVFEGKQFPDSIAKIVINEERLEMLKSIKDVFVQQNTNYKIVISPLYDQVKLNPCDLQVLIDIFGQDNVFDFSGVNQWNVDFHNYYEDSHYRPCVANEIMEIVYNKNTQS